MRPIFATLSAAALAILATGDVLASDHFHECRTADGRYTRGPDGVLTETAEQAATQSREVKFRKLSETVIAQTRSYCIGTGAFKGQRFQQEEKVYVEQIEVTEKGRKQTTWLLCQLLTDGTPAAATCGEPVVSSRKGPGPGPRK